MQTKAQHVKELQKRNIRLTPAQQRDEDSEDDEDGRPKRSRTKKALEEMLAQHCTALTCAVGDWKHADELVKGLDENEVLSHLTDDYGANHIVHRHSHGHGEVDSR